MLAITTSSPPLSVVIPAYNERQRLPETLLASLDYLRATNRRWEILVVDDGSTDDTGTWIETQQTDEPRLRLLRSPSNCGKGEALAAGARHASGERVLFMDADGGTPLSSLPKLEAAMEADESCSVVVGSRQRIAGPRPLLRRVMGVVFAALTATCVCGVADTQCGFKLLTREAAAATMPYLHVNRWAYDVELLFLAQQLNLGVASVEVPAVDMAGSKIRWYTPIQMLLDVLRVSVLYRIGLWAVPRGGRGKAAALSGGAGASYSELRPSSLDV